MPGSPAAILPSHTGTNAVTRASSRRLWSRRRWRAAMWTPPPTVAFFNVTFAKIASGCMPAHVRGVDLEGKMVDYCILVCDEQVQNAARSSIAACLQSTSPQPGPSSQPPCAPLTRPSTPRYTYIPSRSASKLKGPVDPRTRPRCSFPYRCWLSSAACTRFAA